jgi:hypothetical protein
MGAGSSSGGGRLRRQRTRMMSEINVTPFVDVMLVLLIVFMVAAPLLTVGVPIDLCSSRGIIAFRPIVRERFARHSLNVLPIENAKRPFVNIKS